MAPPDVIVVGGGFAGLAAATQLASAGARVLVLDARPRLGGRATAFRDRVTGELVDNGQHVLFGCYRETLRFLRRIGAEENVRAQPALHVPYIDRRGMRSVLRCPPLPAPIHLLAGVLDWDVMPWRERLAALRLAAPIRRARRSSRGGEADQGLKGITVAEWLTRYSQGRKLRQWLWEPLAVAALNQRPDEAAAEPFVRVLAEMFGPDPAASAVVLPNKPLHQMYAEPARDFIVGRGGEVRINAPARIVFGGDRVAGVEVRGERIDAPSVIAAVPWCAVRGLLGPAAPAVLGPMLADCDRMQSKPIVTVNLWYDRPVMEDVFVGLPGRATQWVFDKRLAFGEAASHLSLVSSAADALVASDADTLIARAAAEIRDALPDARTARLLRGTVIREKHATFSLAPGQPARPGTRTPVGGLLLAGDWIDTGLPGTIESAVVSGTWAAAAVR